MEASVVYLYFKVNHFVAGKEAVLRRALNTLVDCGDIFLGNRTANRHILERVTGTGLAGNKVKFAVSVLTFTARLTLVHTFRVASLTERFAVSNLRRANVCFDFEFPQKSVNDNVEVKLAHTRDNRLTRFLVCIRFESGVFFGKLNKRQSHLFLSRFRLRLYGELDNGVGESHLLQNNGVLFVAQRVARSRIFQTNDCADIARINFGNFHTRVCVHLNKTTYALLFALRGVIHVGTCGKHAGVSSEISKSANKGVGCNFKRKTSKRLAIGGLSLFLFSAVGVYALYVVYVDRGRKIVDYGVQKHLNALILIRRAAKYGRAFHCYGSLAQPLADFFGSKFHSFEELLHKLVVALSRGFHQSHMRFFGGVLHICGNFVPVILLSVVGIVNFGVHFNKVDYSLKGVFLAYGQFDGHGIGVKPVLHHLYGAHEVCAVDVHLIYICYTGNFILVSLTPNGFGLRLNAALCAERCNGAVEYAQGTLYFNGEVNVPRGIDDIDPALVRLGFASPRPVAGGSRGSNGYTALLFLYHPVHSSGTVVRFAYLVVNTCIKENSLGSSRLAGVDVRHNTDVSRMQ